MDLKYFFQKPPAWIKTEANDRNALYSSARFTRNYKGYLFPDKSPKQRLHTIEVKADKALKTLLECGDLIKVNIETLTDNELLLLSERRILPRIGSKERAAVRLYIYKDLKTFILLNYKDHVNVYAHASASKIKSAYNCAVKLLAYFDDSMFSTDEDGNYLTSDISYHGTGFKPYITLILPYLRSGRQLAQLTSLFAQNGIIYTKYFNFGSDTEDLLVASIADSYTLKPADAVGKIMKFYDAISSLEKEAGKTADRKLKNETRAKLESLAGRDTLSFKGYVDHYFSSLIASDMSLFEKINTLKLKRALFDFQIGSLSYLEKKILREKNAAALRAVRMKKMIK